MAMRICTPLPPSSHCDGVSAVSQPQRTIGEDGRRNGQSEEQQKIAQREDSESKETENGLDQVPPTGSNQLSDSLMNALPEGRYPNDLIEVIRGNLDEVLAKILQFTEMRREVLHENIKRAEEKNFVPKDLPVREFAEALNEAVVEHLRSHRLLFRDTSNIRFGTRGRMRIIPLKDPYAAALLAANKEEYMEMEVNKLMENSLNCKVAEELLRKAHQDGEHGITKDTLMRYEKPNVKPSETLFSPLFGIPHSE
jgi:flagellar basal body rod protein FlgB